jgi:hypothetical protein
LNPFILEAQKQITQYKGLAVFGLGDTLIFFRPFFKSSQEGRRELKGGFKNQTKTYHQPTLYCIS